MRRADLAERGVSAGLIVAPWLALAWSPPTLLASLFGALTIAAAALHGFGGALAILLDRSAGAPLLLATAPRRPAVDTLGLGAAVLLLVGGSLAALGRFDHRVQLGVLIIGLVLHTVAVAHHHRDADLVARTREALGRADVASVLLWFVLLAVLVLHVLGLVSSQHNPVYDDDGHWFAAVKRLRDTGGFDDPVGYGRAYQLGGSVVSSALAATIGDVRCTRIGEALGFVLTFLGLAQLALSPADRRQAAALIFLLLALAISSKAQGEFDASLFWLPCALFVAVFRQLLARRRAAELRRGDGAWLAILLAGICAIRLEYLPFAFAIAAAAPAPRLLDRAKQALALVGGVLLCLAPMLIDWRRSGDLDNTHAFARFAPIVATLVVTAIALAIPRRPRTPFAVFSIAIAITAAITTAIATPAGEFSSRVVWVPIYALLYVALAALAQVQWAPRAEVSDLRQSGDARARFRFVTAAVLVLSAVAFIMRAQDPTVHLSWRYRYRMWVEDAGELAVAAPRPAFRDDYAALLHRVPASATVLLWVDHPERLDFAARDMIDLRVPRHRDLRAFDWGARSSALPRLIRATGARYLLVEGDMLDHARAKASWLFSIWCTAQNPMADPVLGRPAMCADPLEQALLAHHVMATADGVTLLDLTRDR